MWRLINKDKSEQPAGDDYTQWKEQIAKECYHSCVYCSIHENPWGGIDHYHIDHYRPKSRPIFKQYELDIRNLFYACPVCNRFKSDDWPNEPDEFLDVCCYPDPSKIDYSTIFELDDKSFKLLGKNKAAKYIIERLYLNRPQLIFERRESYLNDLEQSLQKNIHELVRLFDDNSLTSRFLDAIIKLSDLKHRRKNIRPYKLTDIRKNAKKN